MYLAKDVMSPFKIQTSKEEFNSQFTDTIGEEIMYGDIWKKEDYLNWMYTRLVAIKEIMTENASIYVQLDSKIGHYVKVMMDEIFGENNFLNEIIWEYQGSWVEPKDHYPKRHQLSYIILD